MNDAISRSAIADILRGKSIDTEGDVRHVAVEIHKWLRNLDVAPVVHAKWIYGITLRHEWRKCSECLVSQDIFGCFTYCPNCGARMDGEAE